MKVLVAFEFNDVDPASEVGKQIINDICESCEVMGVGFNADACLVDDVKGD